MRTEATIEEWKQLYEVTTRIRELEPWKLLQDMDLIGIWKENEPENTAFYSILGKCGECYGVVVYEGYKAYNQFLMILMQKQLNLSEDFVMSCQNNLTCYWGNREELTAKQRAIIKELGYKSRGKNNWLYFMAFEPGYYPYNLNRDEVLRMTEHMKNLEQAYICYRETDVPVDFEHGNMFAFVKSADGKSWRCGEEPLLFTCYNYGNLMISDEELLQELTRAPKEKYILEADVRPMGAGISDKQYDKPANPMMSILTDVNTGMVFSCELNEPGDDALVNLAEALTGFIFKAGAPKEIRVSNIIVEAAVEHICEICKIKLRRMKQLKGTDDFFRAMNQYL